MDREQIIKVVLMIVGVAALLYVINLYTQRSQNVESFENDEHVVQPTGTMGQNEIYGDVNSESDSAPVSNAKPTDSFPKDQLNAADLLPGNGDNAWGQSVPSSGALGDGNFLTAGYHSGVNTVGQSLRNANRQLRSEPANPQVKVSPWQQSSIQPDTNRQSLEIGNCA